MRLSVFLDKQKALVRECALQLGLYCVRLRVGLIELAKLCPHKYLLVFVI